MVPDSRALNQLSRAIESHYGKPQALQLVGPFAQTSHFSPELQRLFIDSGVKWRGATDQGLAIGDGDSATGSMDLSLPKVKDMSDLEVALRILPRQTTHLELLGFLGGARDHDWMNLLLFDWWLRDDPDRSLIADHQVFGFSGQQGFQHQGRFSLLSLQLTSIQLGGAVEYPYIGELRPGSTQTLGNQASGEFQVGSEGPCFVLLEA